MSTHSSANAAPRRTHGIMARLTRLAAGVLLVTLVAAAFTALSQATSAVAPVHRCIHDEVQARVMRSVASQRMAPVTLSAVGLPLVEAASGASASSDEPTDGSGNGGLATDSSPDVTRSAEWGDFRVTISAEDLTTPGYYCSAVGEIINNHNGEMVTCAAEDVLTDEKRDVLINYLVPQAVQMHTDRLKVQQVQGAWKVTGMFGEVCGDFKVPEEHLTTGVNNTDFVLYVTSVPSEYGIMAWGSTCQVFTDEHPAVGGINIPAYYIKERYDQYMIHTVTHEMAHSIGFGLLFFEHMGMTGEVTGIRGKTTPAIVMNSTNVVEKTREHFGCDAAEYMELEDVGGPGTMGSHWKLRNAQDELMSGMPGVAYYTNLTLAAFEDLGYYKPDYSKAETMKWGRNIGCAVLDDKCLVDSVTQFPSMFCDQPYENVFRCEEGRLGVGLCIGRFYDEELPEYFQYFTGYPTLGGFYDYFDYCPVIMGWVGGVCSLEEGLDPMFDAYNSFSMSSRCLDGNFTPKDDGESYIHEYYGLCARLTCDTATQTYSIYVKGSTEYYNCTPGETVDLSTISDAFVDGSYITCPPYLEVCQSNVQAIRDFEYGTTTTTSTTTTTTTTTTAAPTTTTTTTTEPSTSTTTAAPAATTTTATPGGATDNTTTTAAPSGGRGNAAASLCSPRVVVAALLAMVLAVVAV